MALNPSLRAQESSHRIRRQLLATIGFYQGPERLKVAKEWLLHYYDNLFIKTEKVDNEYIATLKFFDIIHYDNNAFHDFLINTESPDIKRTIVEYALALFSEILRSRSNNGVHIDYDDLLVQYESAAELVYHDTVSALDFVMEHSDEAQGTLDRGPQNESEKEDWHIAKPVLEFWAAADTWVGVEGEVARAVGGMLKAVLEKGAGLVGTTYGWQRS